MITTLPDPEDQLGSYRLVREIGRGAMGVVYEAEPIAPDGSAPPDRRVALKLLVFPPLLPEEEREALIIRFAREARALALVRHPNVVRVYDVDQVEGQPYLVMEYLAGQNARERLLRRGPMPPEQVIALGCQLCEALAAVHASGIIHRDIKPDNVVLEADGSIRLTDFGIARVEVEASLTRTGGLVGSPAYMAPEQILGGVVDARADLFSAGVTLYQMLTGELPFQGSSIMEVAHRVAYEPPRPLTGAPPTLAVVLLRALAKDPAQRYATAGELREALDRSLVVPEAGLEQTMSPVALTDRVSADLSPSASYSPSMADPCVHHPGRRAVAYCAECETPVCGRCVRYRLSRAWCPEHFAPRARPAWVTRLEVAAIGLLFALLLWSLYPARW